MKRDRITNEKNENGKSIFKTNVAGWKAWKEEEEKRDMIHVHIHENIKIEGVKANAPDQNVKWTHISSKKVSVKRTIFHSNFKGHQLVWIKERFW